MRVLFVCLGNICRSPGAEAVFAARAHGAGLDVAVDSAGTAGWHVGDPPYDAMIRAAAVRGYDLGGLRARQFTVADFAAFGLIVAMDADNLRDIEALRPPGCQTPAVRFMDYAPQAGAADVPDPYFTRDFEAALDLIELAARGLVAQLS
ncbi:MAG: low molecular weight protein-tyrosine-phosphatase [Paracoccaceae bacterium]